MSRRSDERRAKQRAAANDKIGRVARRIFGPDAAASELAVVRAEHRVANDTLDELGLTTAGLLQVGAKAAEFTNDVVAKDSLEVIPNACSAGCAWCCVLEISAWPAEVFQLAARIESQSPPVDVERLVGRLRECVETRDVENEAGRAPKVPCPLLAVDRTCSVYGARPSACSAGMANDAGPCRMYAEGGDDDAGGFITVPEVFAPAVTAAVVIAERGGPPLDGTGASIDLHTGLATALAAGVESTTSRWLAREDVFREARERMLRRQKILAALGPSEEVFLRRSRD